MNGHGRVPPVLMPKLFVRATLANLDETKRFEDNNDLAGLQNRKFVPSLGNCYGLGAHELTFQLWFALLQEHLNDLFEICVQFI